MHVIIWNMVWVINTNCRHACFGHYISSVYVFTMYWTTWEWTYQVYVLTMYWTTWEWTYQVYVMTMHVLNYMRMDLPSVCVDSVLNYMRMVLPSVSDAVYTLQLHQCICITGSNGHQESELCNTYFMKLLPMNTDSSAQRLIYNSTLKCI